MSDQENKNPIGVKEEEIDLGKLFSLIGNAFSKFFKFVGGLLKGVFHYFIVLLLFLKEHIVKIAIATVLGYSIGFVLDYIASNEYSYDMIIEPNYESVHQIFERMEYFNVLIQEEDSIALSKEFDISYSDANSLLSFALTPYETKKDQILAYDAFIKKTDTLTQELFTFSDFNGEGTSQFDSRRYAYRILSTNVHLKLFGDKIITDIERSPTVKKKREIKLMTLKLDSISARISLAEIDSLRGLYKKISLLEVGKETGPASSTYLDFSKESKSNNNDLALFKLSKELNQKLVDIEKEKETSIDIVRVITNFNPVGNNRKPTFLESDKFQYGSFFGGFVIVFLLLKRLNIYLVKYKEQSI